LPLFGGLTVLRRRGLWIALCVLGLVLPAVGQGTKDQDKTKPAAGGDKAANLKWKFEKDKPFYQEMTTTTEQNMKVMNSDVTQKQSQTFWFSWTPTGQDKDGNWTIKQKIDGVKMKIEIGGTPIEYDSTKDQTGSNPLSDFFKQLVGSEFTLTVDKDLKVKDVAGRKEFIDKLAAANPQMKPLLDQILSDQALKEMADPTFAAVPNKEVKKGDKGATWKRESKLNMGPIGRYENTYDYTYEGKDEKQKNLDRIKVATTLKYFPPEEAQGAANPLPFKIKSANLTSSDAGGTILFNEDKGRVESSDLSLTLKGELSIEIGGTTTKVDLNQKQNTTVKTTDSPSPALKGKTT
jgi:uncharacterized protein DUF6263